MSLRDRIRRLEKSHGKELKPVFVVMELVTHLNPREPRAPTEAEIEAFKKTLDWRGCPVHLAFWTQATPVMNQHGMCDIRYIHAFLGLVSGHYDAPKRLETTGEYSEYLGEIKAEINTGIAFVTPAEAIRQLLMREDLLGERQERKKKIQSQRPKGTLDIGQIEERA
jgi:hypothetical protein